MLVIDKDIQFQYQQRAYCHDNVICWIFNSNVVCLPLLSPSIHLVCFPFFGMASSTLNLAHSSQFTSTRHWKADSQKHHRGVLKNRRMQKEHWAELQVPMRLANQYYFSFKRVLGLPRYSPMMACYKHRSSLGHGCGARVCHNKITNAYCFGDPIMKVIMFSISRFMDV